MPSVRRLLVGHCVIALQVFIICHYHHHICLLQGITAAAVLAVRVLVFYFVFELSRRGAISTVDIKIARNGFCVTGLARIMLGLQGMLVSKDLLC